MNAQVESVNGLLVLHILIIGDQYVKFLLGKPKQFAVLFTRPSTFGNGPYSLRRDLIFQFLWETFVKKNFHTLTVSNEWLSS